MKKNKHIFMLVLSSFALSLLAACNDKTPSNQNSNPPAEEEEERILEIGDVVKEWTSKDDNESCPFSEGVISEDFGSGDKTSLKFEVSPTSGNKGSVTTNIENPYFIEDDAKNGDIISAYFYIGENSNLSSIQLSVLPSSMNESNAINAEEITITEENQGEWIRSVISYDTLETLGAIKINYTALDSTSYVSFFVDDVRIVLGEETVKTDYVSNEESLCQTYADYFKVGTAISASGLRNTEMRKITKDNFNSVTAENEAKPEQVLDKSACQALANSGAPTEVAITTAPFEKLYDFCEASHIGVRHHTFVWYSQTPDWFFNEGYQDNGKKVSKEVMLQRMENYIKVSLETVNERWPGLVYAVDVANEAIDNGLRKNNNNWYTTVGDDFVYYAFVYANRYKAEDQELYYNDYSYDYNTSNCTFALDTLLKKAIEEDLVDGVGIQGHIDSDQNMDVVIKDAELIKEKGLKCQITELDITVSGTDDAAWEKQGKAYSLLIKRVLQSNAEEKTDINGIIVWGITDNTSWKSYQNPLLFTSNYGKKPAYYSFLNAISEVNE